MVKTRTRAWLLKSNGERIFDEFASNASIGRYNPDKNTKQLIYEEEAELAPLDVWGVALVYEVDDIYDSEDPARPAAGMSRRSTYAVPFMGYELTQQLEGRLLDYVDATYADKEQRESQKRIIRRTIHEFRQKASEINENKFKNAEIVKIK